MMPSQMEAAREASMPYNPEVGFILMFALQSVIF